MALPWVVLCAVRFVPAFRDPETRTRRSAPDARPRLRRRAVPPAARRERHAVRWAFVAMVALAVAGCGGRATGGHVAVTPPPPRGAAAEPARPAGSRLAARPAPAPTRPLHS